MQKSFALELLGKTPPPGQEDDFPVNELAKPLLGQELTMRYAQRVSPSAAGEDTATKSVAPSAPSSIFRRRVLSVISREQKLKIVGISDLDPDNMRGARPGAGYFCPLNFRAVFYASCSLPTYADSMRGFKQTAQLFHHQRAGKKSKTG